MSVKDDIKGIRELGKLLASDGGILGGSSSPAERAALNKQVADKRASLQTTQEGRDALLRMDVKDRQQADTDRLAGIKGFGKSLIGDQGLAKAGSNFTAGGVGKAVEGIGGVIPGAAGEGVKIAGAILQVVGKIDEWAKAQLTSNFEQFRGSSIAMNRVETQFQRQMGGIEMTKGDALAPVSEMLASAQVDQARTFMGVETAWKKGTTKLAADFTKGTSVVGDWWQETVTGVFGKGEEYQARRAKEKEDSINNTTVDLAQWALDDTWINDYMMPKDF